MYVFIGSQSDLGDHISSLSKRPFPHQQIHSEQQLSECPPGLLLVADQCLHRRCTLLSVFSEVILLSMHSLVYRGDCRVVHNHESMSRAEWQVTVRGHATRVDFLPQLGRALPTGLHDTISLPLVLAGG